MSELTHLQAKKFIQAAMHGLVSPIEQEALLIHLNGCVACRQYQSQMRALEGRLRHAMHARWDGQKPASVLTFDSLTSKMRLRSILKNFFNLATAGAALVTVVLLVVFAIQLLPAQEHQPVSEIAMTTEHPATPTPSAELMERYDLSPEAQLYVATALDIMESHSINRDIIEWPAFREEVYRRAYGARSSSDTYAAIRFALNRIEQNGYFVTPQTIAQENQLVELQPRSEIEGRLVGERIGYIQIPTTRYYDPEVYANAMQDRIRQVDGPQVCGWVVDLRGNTGGGIGPMLVGAGPILGEGMTAGFQYPDGSKAFWHYIDGELVFEDSGIFETALTYLKRPAYRLKHPDPSVAVLTDFGTAGAGEALVIAFKGKTGTRSFGQPTAGATVGSSTFMLSDGAQLVIITSYMIDSQGVVYNSTLRPDQLVWDLGQAGDQDPIIQAGVDWLLEQERCK
jgi:carboxyl-terminal processing protease